MSPTFLMSELAATLCRSRTAPFLMLRAYFDESGHEATSDVLAMGGFLGLAEEWDLLAPKWEAILAKFGLPEFHASKMNRKIGPLCKGWPESQMIQLMTELLDAITERDFLSISAAVHLPDFRSVVSGNAWLSARLGSPYQLVYHFSLQAVHNWTERNPNTKSERASVVFAQNDEYGGLAQIHGNQYSAHSIWGQRIESVSFASSANVPPLQAADLLAYESYKRFTNVLIDGGIRVPRKSYLRIAQEMAMAPETYYDASSIVQLGATMALNEGHPEVAVYLSEEFGEIWEKVKDRILDPNLIIS